MTRVLADNSSLSADTGPHASMCIVVDPDFGFLHDFCRSLRNAGVDAVELVSSKRLADNVEIHNPEIVFIDLNPNSPYDCVRAMLTLKECGFTGRVQLFGRCEPAFLENFCRIGSDASLTMLPAMQKPFNFSVVTETVLTQKLSRRAAPAPALSLRTAIESDLITFWYQPKIDLRKRQVVGAECFARISHPLHGIISPAHFLAGAADDEITELTNRALVAALKFSAKMDGMGIHFKVAINVSTETLVHFPTELLLKNRPQNDQWPGILIEVAEAQLLNKIVTLRDKLQAIEKYGISLAIDNFGRGNSSFSVFRFLPFSEIKIDASFTQGCANNKGNANICSSMIQIAHTFQRSATAVGIETREDAQKITELGCDTGQGHLFGKPMTEQQLISMITEGRAKSENFYDQTKAMKQS